MLIAWHNRYSELNRILFHESNAPIGDDLLLPFVRLAEEARKRGIEVCALNDRRDRVPDAVVFLDYPLGATSLVLPGVPLYLVHFENETIVPENFDPVKLAAFKRVFTWHEGLLGETDCATPGVNARRFVPLRYAQDLPPVAPLEGWRKFCCMIASAKSSPHPASLYGERVETARAFADRYCGFHLYGPGWGAPSTCYQGTIPPGQKRATLQKYDFAICYENARGLPGYVTEKIFDCFAAGTIPVYWGAPNVTDYVWPECFVDRRHFASNEELYHRLRGMTRDEKRGYRAMIDSYLGSDDAKRFKIERWVDVLLGTIAGDLG